MLNLPDIELLTEPLVKDLLSSLAECFLKSSSHHQIWCLSLFNFSLQYWPFLPGQDQKYLPWFWPSFLVCCFIKCNPWLHNKSSKWCPFEQRRRALFVKIGVKGTFPGHFVQSFGILEWTNKLSRRGTFWVCFNDRYKWQYRCKFWSNNGV